MRKILKFRSTRLLLQTLDFGIKMTNKILKVSFILFCALISCVLFGCKNESIKFYRESKVQNLMHDFQSQDEQKGVIKKSSGIIIYKDTSNDAKSQSGTHFGPKDINFDLPVK